MASGSNREETLLEGPGARIVHMVGHTNRSQIRDFLEKLRSRRLRQYEKIIAILELVMEVGPQTIGSDRVKSLGKGLFEFRSGQVRLFWIYDEDARLQYPKRKVVLLYGRIKKRARLDANTMRHIRNLKHHYEQGRDK